MAIDNARLHRSRAEVARTLQATLLPPELPDVPGAELAAEYHPSGDGVEVGGDFYDVFSLSDDRWVIMIGDVCGTGPAAAALTSQIRHGARVRCTGRVASGGRRPRDKRFSDRHDPGGPFLHDGLCRARVAPERTGSAGDLCGPPASPRRS